MSRGSNATAWAGHNAQDTRYAMDVGQKSMAYRLSGLGYRRHKILLVKPWGFQQA